MTDRQTKILEIVNQKKKVEVATLSQMLEVSQVTIRKDLDALEELNFLTREHGYATMKNMSDIGNRMAFCYETKQRIAEKASEIISDGETIMVESGSSCALLVKYLSETKKDITVITNSSYIARFIRETEGGVTKVIVLGGEYQKEAEVMVGPLVKTCAEAFYVDKKFTKVMDTKGSEFKTVPSEIPIVGNPVIRNENVDQIEVLATNLRCREDSSLKANITGYLKPGIYDYFGKISQDGYEWYKIEYGYVAFSSDWMILHPKKDIMDDKKDGKKDDEIDDNNDNSDNNDDNRNNNKDDNDSESESMKKCFIKIIMEFIRRLLKLKK